MNTCGDETEELRRSCLAEISAAVQSLDPEAERKRLETEHGKVWDAHQLNKRIRGPRVPGPLRGGPA